MNIEINCIYTDADIKAFADNYSRCVLKFIRTAWIILAVISGVLLFINIRDVFGVVELLLVVIIAVSLCYLIFDPVGKVMFKANAHIKGSPTRLAFYDDYFYEKSSCPMTVTESSVRYEYIKSVYETQTHFFIYTNSGHCHIVPRKEINPDDYLVLRTFLSAKVGAAFKTV